MIKPASVKSTKRNASLGVLPDGSESLVAPPSLSPTKRQRGHKAIGVEE